MRNEGPVGSEIVMHIGIVINDLLDDLKMSDMDEEYRKVMISAVRCLQAQRQAWIEAMFDIENEELNARNGQRLHAAEE